MAVGKMQADLSRQLDQVAEVLHLIQRMADKDVAPTDTKTGTERPPGLPPWVPGTLECRK